ncbi:MAG: imidazole glycerol phosphate synthase subunit HisH [Actinobacteria bacterium]|nr:imidazole glycerol phosphate synthase subunit HisH [Actinomycetota bacterium]
MGNLRSVAKALEAAGASVVVTSDRSDVDDCDALCVPGQGIFGRCMTNLVRNAFDDVVRSWIAAGKPYLGICLGMQILFDSSEENPDVRGLGIIAGRVTRLPSTVRVPHIGWNTVAGTGGADPEYFYFDHSYAAHPDDDAVVAGWCEHGEPFAATIRTGSILGTQFHPEKSGRSGLGLLREWGANQ